MISVTDLPESPAGKSGWPWTEETKPDEWLKKRSAWPRVSIVIPSFNQGEFIEEAIRSVLLQGYPDLELIVCDGGSNDGAADIIRKYAQWLTYWTSEKDRGQSDAINKGLRKSTGRYFNWQNSDDVLAPSSLFKSVNALMEHPEASHVHGYRIAIKSDGSFHSTSEHSYGPPTRLAPDVSTSLRYLKCGMQPGCLMDRKLVNELGGVDENLHYVMDTDILLKLSMIKPPLYLHELVVYYRMHDRTKSHNEWPASRIGEKLRVVENLFKLRYSEQYSWFKRSAMATGHRYAWECAARGGMRLKFWQHFLMDIACSPFGDWDRRRAVFQALKAREY